jgi:hypothetical protein
MDSLSQSLTMPLNLPAYDMALRPVDNGVEVYDALRRKWVRLTPEERVRQYFVNYLVAHRGYSPHFMANEVGIRLNNTLRRCDTVVYDASGRPAMIVEYKSPVVAVTQRTFDQILRYNIVLGTRYLVVANGLRIYCCEVDSVTGKVRFLRDLPDFKDVKRGKR